MVVHRLAELLGESAPAKPSPKEALQIVSRALRISDRSDSIDQLKWALEPGFTIPPGAGREYLVAILLGLQAYYDMLSRGVSLEDARYVLPQSIKTRIVFTMNARELLEVFLPLRMCSRAQWEIRILAWSVRSLLVKVHPVLWRYAGPRCVRVDQLARRRLYSLEDYIEARVKPVIERCPEGVPRDSIHACLASNLKLVYGEC